ncbi:MAG TPA: GNAT family N-acetyltransferase [Solirubrobacteraceae bacterium]|nr:GNAT family N-acetyltransferase [Solirubrobacteraceae bacterium]
MVESTVIARALAWSRHESETLSQSAEPFPHGVVYRSAEFPDFAAVNLVRVAGDPGWSAAEAAAFADQALRGAANRLIIFEDVGAGERLRAGLGRLGYMTTRIVWMRHRGGPAPVRSPGSSFPGATDRVELREVPHAAVNQLRAEWLHEDFGDRDMADYIAQSARARARLNTRTIAAFRGAQPIGFSAVDIDGDGAEVGAVFVRAPFRGQGVGTLLTVAGIDAAGSVADLWISADDEDRPKDLYARLGFAPVLRVMDCIRLGS